MRKKGRRFGMGDVHGAHKALLQCLEAVGFDYRIDTLIQLGDVVDGYAEVYECVETLLKIKNLIAIRGNHDDWFRRFLMTYVHPALWTQGGMATLASYLKNGCARPDDPAILSPDIFQYLIKSFLSSSVCTI